MSDIFQGCNSANTATVIGMTVEQALAALPTAGGVPTTNYTVMEDGVAGTSTTVIKEGKNYVVLPAAGDKGQA